MEEVSSHLSGSNEPQIEYSTSPAFQGQSQLPQLSEHIVSGNLANPQHPPAQQYENARQGPLPQTDMAKPQRPGQSGPLNMNTVASAPPQSNYRSTQYVQQRQRFNPSAGSFPEMMTHLPIQQPGGQAGLVPLATQQYYVQQQQHPHVTPFYPGPFPPSQAHASIPGAGLAFYHSPITMNQLVPSSGPYYYTPIGPFQTHSQGMSAQIPRASYSPATAASSDPRWPRSPGGDQVAATSPPRDQGIATPDSRRSIVRGPPRKPRQSGHAIWIGNLPPHTDLMSLVHHVCKETSGLESLFLISKSNCAFANFKDEQLCSSAQQKLHDSRFQTVRLVSRLRKSAVEGVTGISAPTGPAASAPQSTGLPAVDGIASNSSLGVDRVPQATDSTAEPGALPAYAGRFSHKDRFFILKSLTVEDLELSSRTGIWATQSHNEETLNKAFESADNVYLIFSANKSGEYFGYARMISSINDDPGAAIEFTPRSQTSSDLHLPKAIPTEAFESTPKGHIIDDSARGTIFWEVEREDSELGREGQVDGEGSGSGPDSVAEDGASGQSGADEEAAGESKAWGKPFKLEWLSTARLPFYRTRGLRNPWNSNREVKIARDGTELEPSVGRRLIGLFNKLQSPTSGVMPVMPGRPRSSIPMIPGPSGLRLHSA